MEDVRPFLHKGSAEKLPFADHSFDLVLFINSIHNLPKNLVIQSLQEIERVGKNGQAFVTVDAWRDEKEKENLEKWVLTAKTTLHVNDWVALFLEAGYRGDYYWFIAE